MFDAAFRSHECQLTETIYLLSTQRQITALLNCYRAYRESILIESELHGKGRSATLAQ